MVRSTQERHFYHLFVYFLKLVKNSSACLASTFSKIRSALNRFALDVNIADVSESIRSIFAELPTVLSTIFAAAATDGNFAPYISMNLTACSVSDTVPEPERMER